HPGEAQVFPDWMFGPEPPPNQRWIVRGLGTLREEAFVGWDLPFLSDYHVGTRNDPGAALIGHELIHCLHFIRGGHLVGGRLGWGRERFTDSGRARGYGREWCHDNYEEDRTIGVFAYHFGQEEISENAIRHDLGAPLRRSHCGFEHERVPWISRPDSPLRG